MAVFRAPLPLDGGTFSFETTTETATTDARRKAQDAYDAAKADLATLKSARPVTEGAFSFETGRARPGACAVAAFVLGNLVRWLWW
jgi:hypothetical protein